MITHLFKLIWNKKKQNFLLMSEMLVSFIVMFAMFTLIVYYYQNYNYPRGFDYENVWSLRYVNPAGMRSADSIADFRQSVRQVIQSMPQVADVSFSGANIPFGNVSIGTSVARGKIEQGSYIYRIDEHYKNVLNLHMDEGRWFSKEDNVTAERHIIINHTLKEKLFGKLNATGQLLDDKGSEINTRRRIIGVVQDLKDKGDYTAPESSFYEKVDTGSLKGGGAILIKIKASADAGFESRLYKKLSAIMKDTSIEIKHLDKERITINNQALGPIIVLLIIAGFLIINVALGLFGVLWYSINKRKAEIGLRRAVGASASSILKQLVGEALVLSTFSLIVGTFFAVQFPLLNVFNLASNTYLAAIGLSTVFIYLLVLICALYPGKQAADIYPAIALHED